MGKIKAFIYGRYGSGKILYSACSDRGQEKSVSTESEFVIGKLKEIRLVANERQKITLESTGQQFQWFCLCDNQDIIYMAICSLDYPERHAYQMIQDLRKHFMQISDNYGDETDSVLKMHGKNAAENMLIQYNSDQVDKIRQVQGRLAETKAGLQDNLTAAIDNVGNLERTKEKSDVLQLQSQQLKNNAKDLESIMRWRNYKLNLIFFLIILGVVLYVIFGIIDK